MQKITAHHSRTARSLLKWNIHDLANHVKGIMTKRIDSFEHGMVHLMEWENDELVRAFKKAGIVFKADLEVVLAKDKPEIDSRHDTATHGEGARIVLTSDDVLGVGENVAGASSASETPGKAPGSKEDEKRGDDKTRPK